METRCAGQGCNEHGSRRCSRCKSARYCSRACQEQHWVAGHKQDCNQLALHYHTSYASDLGAQDPKLGHRVGIILIADSHVRPGTLTQEEIPTSRGGDGWELCPMAHMLGVPLAMKRMHPCDCTLCLGPHSAVSEPTNQVVSRLAIEPATGLAPQRWRDGQQNHLGTVAVARTDRRCFRCEDWAILDAYIMNNVMDVWRLDPPDRDKALPGVYSKDVFRAYSAAANADFVLE